MQGNPDKFEPDYFFNGIPFEFTIASDSKKKSNFVQQFFWGKYSSEDVEQDVFSYIMERICDKASKKYSVENVHLCILCLLDLSNWVFFEVPVTHRTPVESSILSLIRFIAIPFRNDLWAIFELSFAYCRKCILLKYCKA